jgi:pimeloyl-ACP methyl ester carboxylesterase
VQAGAPVRKLLFDKAHLPAEDSLRAMRPYTYAAGTPDALFEEDALVRLAHQPAARDYRAQLYALIYWSAYLQLPRLAMPALVLHGLQDALIPPDNGRALAARLPRATLVELPEASHWLTTDRTDDVLAALRDHLQSHRS